MKHIALVALLLFPLAASAEGIGPRHLQLPSRSKLTLLNDIALNGSATVRKFTLTSAQTDGMAKLVMTVKRTRSAGTDLTMTCTQSPDDGTTNGTVTTCYWDTAGVCTSATATWKSSTSSTETLTWEAGILGYGQVDCTVASTSAGASDKLTIYGVLVTQ